MLRCANSWQCSGITEIPSRKRDWLCGPSWPLRRAYLTMQQPRDGSVGLSLKRFNTNWTILAQKPRLVVQKQSSALGAFPIRPGETPFCGCKCLCFVCQRTSTTENCAPTVPSKTSWINLAVAAVRINSMKRTYDKESHECFKRELQRTSIDNSASQQIDKTSMTIADVDRVHTSWRKCCILVQLSGLRVLKSDGLSTTAKNVY